MEFETFITRLQEVKNISRIENGYGHIICELFYNDILDNDKYMIIDTSTYKKRANRPLIIDNLCAVPDFVITNKTGELNKIKRLGCIEVKFWDKDIEAHKPKRHHNRLIDYYKQKGYLTTYNSHVLYTNGWKWNYYEKNTPSWSFDFSILENCNSDYFNKLIKELVKINWENKSNVID